MTALLVTAVVVPGTSGVAMAASKSPMVAPVSVAALSKSPMVAAPVAFSAQSKSPMAAEPKVSSAAAKSNNSSVKTTKSSKTPR